MMKHDYNSMSEDELLIIPDDETMLTTIDNPFSPKTDYQRWKVFDESHGHDTEQLLARIANIPEEIDDPVQISLMLLEAQLFIVQNDPSSMYKLV